MPPEAEKALHHTWKKCSRSETPLSVRVDYRCTAGAYRRNECPAGLYLLYHGNSTKVGVSILSSLITSSISGSENIVCGKKERP